MSEGDPEEEEEVEEKALFEHPLAVGTDDDAARETKKGERSNAPSRLSLVREKSPPGPRPFFFTAMEATRRTRAFCLCGSGVE